MIYVYYLVNNWNTNVRLWKHKINFILLFTEFVWNFFMKI